MRVREVRQIQRGPARRRQQGARLESCSLTRAFSVQGRAHLHCHTLEPLLLASLP